MVLTCFTAYHMVGESHHFEVSEGQTAQLCTLPYHVITIRTERNEIKLFLSPEQARDLANKILAKVEGVTA